MSTMKTLTINGETYTVTPVVPKSSVTLPANSWEGSGDSYSQVVTLSGVTLHTKVDLQPTPAQLEEFHYKTLAFVAENDGGVVTVYSIGDKPDGNHTIQVTLTEVDESGKIRGNTVGTTTPRPDWNQNDSQKADYIKNKPTELLANADAHLNNNSNPHGVTPAQIGAAPAGSVWTATDPNNDGNIVLQYGGNVEGGGGTGGTVPGGGSSGGGLTAEEVQAMIDASLGVIENGTY